MVRKIVVILLAIVFYTNVAICQDTPGKWSIVAAPSFYLPPKVTSATGQYPVRLLPSCGWNVDIRRHLSTSTKKEFSLFFTWGGTTYITNTLYEPGKYPIVLPAGRRYYILHRYGAIGASRTFNIKDVYQITVGIANRFYRSSINRFSAHANQAGTHNDILVFSAYTKTLSSYWCPEIDVLFSHALFKKYPSWRYELKASVTPFRVIQGEYVVLPDEPDYKSEGQILVRTSYFSVGICYRRIKKQN